MLKYKSIQSLRFLAAFCVLLHHEWGINYGIQSNFEVSRLIFGSAWFGPSAVVIFFVISGFCINLPNINNKNLDASEFFIHRFCRLSLPIIAILPVAIFFNVSYSPIDGWGTWSLVCEAIFYLAYPFIRKWFAFLPLMILFAFTAGIGLHALNIDLSDYPTLSILRMTLFYYPAWLVGCYLAEKNEVIAKSDCDASKVQKWVFRLLVFLLSFLVGWLHYNNFVNMFWGLSILPFLVYFWIRAEIKSDENVLFLASFGAWSYSLYLVHPVAIFGFKKYIFENGILSSVMSSLSVFSGILIALISSLIFFLIVELPTQKFIRNTRVIKRLPVNGS